MSDSSHLDNSTNSNDPHRPHDPQVSGGRGGKVSSTEQAAVSAAPSRAAVVWMTLGLFAFPAAYVMAAGLTASPAGQRPLPVVAAPAQPDLALLEAQARSNPTETNRINLSQAYIDQGMQGRAILVLNALVAEYPRNALGWNNLCVAHTMQQEYNLAIPACEAGIRADSGMQLLRNNLKWAQDERAKVLAALAKEETVPIKDRDAAFFLNQGMNELHLGAYDQAITAWKNCLHIDPRNGSAQNDIGVAQMMQSQPMKAEASFREALAIEPNNALFHNNLSWALSEAASSK